MTRRHLDTGLPAKVTLKLLELHFAYIWQKVRDIWDKPTFHPSTLDSAAILLFRIHEGDLTAAIKQAEEDAGHSGTQHDTYVLGILREVATAPQTGHPVKGLGKLTLDLQEIVRVHAENSARLRLVPDQAAADAIDRDRLLYQNVLGLIDGTKTLQEVIADSSIAITPSVPPLPPA